MTSTLQVPATDEAASVGATALPERFDAVLTIEGERTTDDREIAEGALTWRELPMPLTNAIDVGDDHYGAIIGAIDEVRREGNELRASGSFDLGSDAGQEAARLVAEQLKRWISIDLEVITEEFIEEGDCEALYDPDATADEISDAMGSCRIVQRVLEGRVMGAAIVGFSAFPSAVIVPEGTEIPAATDDGRPAPDTEEGMTACADCTDHCPPAEWFEDPKLDGPTPLTITPQGRVFGHAFTWKECHTGYTPQGECLLAPRSKTGYAYFMTGSIETTDGPRRVGQLTLGTGHADPKARYDSAKAHYDGGQGAVQVADVAVGEDEHGGWVAGAIRSEVTPDERRACQAMSLSGDWRPIGTGMELVALLHVPVPGFPVIASASSQMRELRARAVYADGQMLSLVAAGRVRQESPARRLRRLEEQVSRMSELLMPLRREKLISQVRDRQAETKSRDGARSTPAGSPTNKTKETAK